ncbi:type II secretion system protein [Marinobacter sp. TBZ242]|uniref:Type II secretion system protein n=1 Tax=Marinobacter azerbaijanicus TaxID=3050455 RepID=A0ABT7IGM4_9GAMM|nr:type II secretion system protein [Marinobacter sp. TBZ242]MDL0433310.1 type II secretion system protein [Marinobacter sp. TBZ242]
MNVMNQMAARKEKGFTLIELVMVIVILGILAAFALPRFADFGTDAREAALEGGIGSVKSAAAIAHSRWVANGSVASQPVDLDGAAGITMSAEGYPTNDVDGIGTAAQLDANDFSFNADDNIVLESAEDTDGDGTVDCNFTYNPATGGVTARATSDC